MDYAFNYLKGTKFCYLSSYKYTGVNGSCKASTCGGIANVRTTVMVASNEPAHMSALAGGPVTIAVDAGVWSNYRSGVLTSCGKSVNHGVTLVGYKTSTNSWLVRNSWGSSWGENGYIRLVYGSNICNMTYRTSYPTF